MSLKQKASAVAKLKALVPAPRPALLGGERLGTDAYERFLSVVAWQPDRAVQGRHLLGAAASRGHRQPERQQPQWARPPAESAAGRGRLAESQTMRRSAAVEAGGP